MVKPPLGTPPSTPSHIEPHFWPCNLTLHLHILPFPTAIHLHTLRRTNPQHIIAPDEHLSQTARALAINKFLRVAQLNVHVGIHANESPFVLGLPPFEADDHVFVDQGLEHGPRVHGCELAVLVWFQCAD